MKLWHFAKLTLVIICAWHFREDIFDAQLSGLKKKNPDMFFAFELVVGKVPIVGDIPYGNLAILSL